jgi:hypothetical protein
MPRLANIWHMVARSAFAQLRYSTVLLVVCVSILAIAFWVPVAGIVAARGAAWWLSLTAVVAMVATYVPVLRYYKQSPLWALALPVAGTLYLLMTISSAVRAWRGVRSSWKGREYGRHQATS